MINYKKGDIINTDAEALVNTVNTEGVMGKGIALEFKERFPDNYKLYKKACGAGQMKVGSMLTFYTNRFDNPQYIINFPTKKHWRNPSKISYIKEGLEDLKRVVIENNIKSIAIPPLGCGNGKLNWKDVKPLIENTVRKIKGLNVILFEPSEYAYQEKPIEITKKNIGLTPARAMVLSALDRYKILGYDLTLLEAQKLVYFVQRLGQKLNLIYSKNQFGPYAKNLDYLLNHLDGVYIMGMKHKNIKPYDPINVIDEKKNEIKKYLQKECTPEQRKILQKVTKLIEGFESPLGMELLSTVDYILKDRRDLIGKKNYLDFILHEINNWSIEEKWNKRKQNLLKPGYIKIAYNKLIKYKDILYAN